MDGMCCVLVKINSYSMSGMYHVQNSQIQHGLDVPWSKIVSFSMSGMERVVVIIDSFSMSGLRCGQNHQVQDV
jgi:hypothetical protein